MATATAGIAPAFVEPMRRSYRVRRSAFLLEHTGDLVVDGPNVLPIELYVPQWLQCDGYELVVTYSLARGVELHGVETREDRERQERLLRQLSGIRLQEEGEERNGGPINGATRRVTPEELLRGLDRLLRQPATRVGLVIYNVERIVQNPSVSGVQMPEQLAIEELVESWGTSQHLRATQNIVIAMTKDAGRVGEAVRKAFVPLSEPLPDRARLKAFVERLQAADSSRRALGALDATVSETTFANVATGLRLMDVESIFRAAAVEQIPVSMDAVVQEKARVIQELADGGLVLLEPLKSGFSGLAGVDHVVNDLQQIARLFREAPETDRLPRAVLLLGPPGTGKSSLARALAHETGGVNVVSWGEMLGPYVGQSEARMDNSLRVLEGLAPVICFIDEVDTAFVSRGEATGDSGTSNRILGKFLKALGDERLRGKVLFVLASNRGDLLDAALLRRCQRVYLVSTPGHGDRVRILQALAHRDRRVFSEDVDLASVATRTEGCTGADLEKILGRAGEIADLAADIDGAPVSGDHIEAAVADHKPNRDPLLHEFFDLISIRTCPFMSGIPWYREGRGLNTPDCPEHVRRVLTDDGSLDVRELNHRIADLAAQCALDRQTRQIG